MDEAPRKNAPLTKIAVGIDYEPELPDLRYSWLRHEGSGIVGDGPPLYQVSEVNAWSRGGNGLTVYARGAMRCKNGLPGPSRAVEIDLEAAQPPWLAAIIRDAILRLEATE